MIILKSAYSSFFIYIRFFLSDESNNSSYRNSEDLFLLGYCSYLFRVHYSKKINSFLLLFQQNPPLIFQFKCEIITFIECQSLRVKQLNYIFVSSKKVSSGIILL